MHELLSFFLKKNQIHASIDSLFRLTKKKRKTERKTHRARIRTVSRNDHNCNNNRYLAINRCEKDKMEKKRCTYNAT